MDHERLKELNRLELVLTAPSLTVSRWRRLYSRLASMAARWRLRRPGSAAGWTPAGPSAVSGAGEQPHHTQRTAAIHEAQGGGTSAAPGNRQVRRLYSVS